MTFLEEECAYSQKLLTESAPRVISQEFQFLFLRSIIDVSPVVLIQNKKSTELSAIFLWEIPILKQYWKKIMAAKRPKGYGYVHLRHKHRKRPGRHSKRLNKRSSRKKNRGQGQSFIKVINLSVRKNFSREIQRGMNYLSGTTILP